MKISHVQALKAPRERVYAALLDPETLKACIDGCESLDPAGPAAWTAAFRAGPLTVQGRVEILDPAPPASLGLKIEGRSGPGSLSSTARVRLLEKDGGTELSAEGEVALGGLAALLGPRLIEAEARKRLAGFFERLAARL